MAKAKKQDTTEPSSAAESMDAPKKAKRAAGGEAPAPAAKRAPMAKAAKEAAKVKSPERPEVAETPVIQTALIAEVAAKMIAQRATGDRPGGGESSGATSAAPRPESSTFKNLKQSLANPGMSGLGGILGTPQNSKKSNQNYSGGGQIGRGQTFGSASKLNLPRRTGG